MKSPHGKNWTREETLVAFNRHWDISSYGPRNKSNPEIIRIASLLGRTPSAVWLKMCNLDALNPEREGGMQNGSKMDEQVWEEFHADRNRLIFESQMVVAELERQTVENYAEIDADISDLPRGEEREQLVKARVNADFFRRAVFSAYCGRCCVTGLQERGLLNASHIVPWSKNAFQRLNPRNGLCLNVLHHKAFDLGLMTVTPSGVIKISPRLIEAARMEPRAAFVAECAGRKIEMPKREVVRPNRVFLEYHNKNIFEKN